jgi:polyhydroxyalkanoate synthesis regulator phasin
MVTQKASEPVQDAVKAYLELAFGLTEASKKKAEKTVKKVAKELMGKGGATASQLQGMAEELVSTGMANREAVTRLVRVEMDRALTRVGLATAEEVVTLTSRVEALERQLRDARAESAVKPATLSAAAVDSVAPAKKAVAKKTVAQKTADVPAAVKKAPAKAPAKKAVAKKTVKKAAS